MITPLTDRPNDEAFFLSVYKTYFPLLFNYGMQLGADSDQLKDCIQDLFIALHAKQHLLREANSIKAYLYSILRRKLYRHAAQSGKFLLLESASSQPCEKSHEALLIDDQEAIEKKRKLGKAFAQLTKRQKEAVYLKFYEDLSYEEIAATMQLEDVKSARNLVYKAIKALKEDMVISSTTSLVPLLAGALLLCCHA